jgi:hypothetical protein
LEVKRQDELQKSWIWNACEASPDGSGHQEEVYEMNRERGQGQDLRISPALKK